MLSSEKKIQNSKVSGRTSRTRQQNADLDELLPHDKMAEQAVLGAIIIQNSVLLRILDILSSDDFFFSGASTHFCRHAGNGLAGTPCSD